MIDIATIEQWMRDANPIPDVKDVDPDEFARFVAATDTRRAATMQAPIQHPTPTGPVTRPPSRRRKVWAFAAAFILVLAAIGVAALVTRGGGEAPVSDEPMAPVTVTTVVTTVPPTSEPLEDLDGWRPVATPAWGDIDQIEPLPGGGYVARVRDRSDQSFVMWSLDGVDWFDGDPQRLVGRVQSPTVYRYGSSLAVVGEQVAVLGSRYGLDEVPLWIGDPRTGTWKRVPLDATGIRVDRRLGLAANDEEVLVAAYAAPAPNAEGQGVVSGQVVVWLVDAASATSTRHAFADSATPSESVPPLVAWVEERWIMIAYEGAVGPEGDARTNSLWTSPDGRAWSQVAIPEGMDGVHSIVAGPSGVAASTCSLFSRVSEPPDDAFWYSSDGLDWSVVPQPGGHSPVIASWGDRGFVAAGPPDDPGVNVIASDGSGMEPMPSPFGGAVAAAASGDTLIVSPEGGGLWLYQAPTGE